MDQSSFTHVFFFFSTLPLLVSSIPHDYSHLQAQSLTNLVDFSTPEVRSTESRDTYSNYFHTLAYWSTCMYRLQVE
jgi:hypothetical protein